MGFYQATSFNDNISQWDVSQGTEFEFMFYQATSFNNDISQWDVSQGTDFGNMFNRATSFNNDISQWDVSQGTNFGGMFYPSKQPSAAQSTPPSKQPSKQVIIDGCLFALISFVLVMFYRRKTNRKCRINFCKAFAHDDSADIFGDDSGLNVKKLSPDA